LDFRSAPRRGATSAWRASARVSTHHRGDEADLAMWGETRAGAPCPPSVKPAARLLLMADELTLNAQHRHRGAPPQQTGPMETLLETLTLERLDDNQFRGRSSSDTAARVYGGQVIAQSLIAAYATISEQVCHSLHCYFLRAGDPKEILLFDVDWVRDSQNFATRRVIARQGEQQILIMSASFMVLERGFEHQTPMPPAPPPETLRDDSEVIAELDPASHLLRQQQRQVFETRSVPPRSPIMRAHKGEPAQKFWIRARETLGADIQIQQATLAYASDLAFLSTTMRPHELTWATPGLQYASLDHSIWFHRTSDLGLWHLYDMDSPTASGGRGLNRGAFYAADGSLIASVAQESLMRMRSPPLGHRAR